MQTQRTKRTTVLQSATTFVEEIGSYTAGGPAHLAMVVLNSLFTLYVTLAAVINASAHTTPLS